MTTLAEVNNSIQSMVEQQGATNDSLQSLVAKIAASGEAAERARLKSTTSSKVKSGPIAKQAPRSIIQGLAQGTGVDGVGGMLTEMLKGVGIGGGLLGGATLGGLFGRAVGKLFFPAVGAFFGVKYLDKWIDPLVNRMLGDNATIEAFGKEIDTSKIVSGIAGAIGVIFGSKLLKGAVVSHFQTNATAKGPKLRQNFLRRLGLASIVLAAGGFAGDWLQSKGTPESMANAVSAGLTGAAIGYQFFGVKGAIIGALAGIAFEGATQLTSYLNSRRSEITQAHIAEATAQLEAADRSTGQAQVQNMLDAKAAIRKAEVQAASITDSAEKAALEESTRILKANRRSKLDAAAQVEVATVPVGQRLLNPELAQVRLNESAETSGTATAKVLEDFLRTSVDLTPSDIDALGKDGYRDYLEGEIANAPFPGLKTEEAVNAAINSFMSLPTTVIQPKEEPVAPTAPRAMPVGRPVNAAQVSSSRPLGQRGSDKINPGNETNMLDAMAATNHILRATVVRPANTTMKSVTEELMQRDHQGNSNGGSGGTTIIQGDTTNNQTSAPSVIISDQGNARDSRDRGLAFGVQNLAM